MRPQGSEDLIGVESVLELFVKLVGSACDGYAAVKLDQAVGQILQCDSVVGEDLMD